MLASAAVVVGATVVVVTSLAVEPPGPSDPPHPASNAKTAVNAPIARRCEDLMDTRLAVTPRCHDGDVDRIGRRPEGRGVLVGTLGNDDEFEVTADDGEGQALARLEARLERLESGQRVL